MPRLGKVQHTFERGEAFAIGAGLRERELVLRLALQALADERVQRRQAVQQWRGILGVQRVLGKARVDQGTQAVFGGTMELVMLFGCLDDGGEVEPTKALELLGLLGDVIELLQHLLQKLLTVCLAELWIFGRRGILSGILLVAGWKDYGQWLEFLLARRGAVA
jgi:hypothetical protein